MVGPLVDESGIEPQVNLTRQGRAHGRNLLPLRFRTALVLTPFSRHPAYSEGVVESCMEHTRQRMAYYRMEARWLTSPFWTRRQGDSGSRDVLTGVNRRQELALTHI
jgi:hypothetical protein